ncbi:MAG: zinc ribbon domain-containing protein, partial [Candidatus Binatia bacterium]
ISFLACRKEFKLREQIEILASLQNIDREIKSKMHVKGALLAELENWNERLEAKKIEVDAGRKDWLEREKLRQDKDRTLQEESAKAVEKRMRMTRIKNIKELQALQREIDQSKQNNSVIEEDLIKLMEELEGYGANLKLKEEELRGLEEQWTAKRGEIEAQLAQIEQAVADVSKGRQDLATRLAADLIGRYELIFSRRGGTAVVEVLGGICQGCHMNIPPQLYNEIMKAERLHLCPSCNRILYYKQAASSNGQI